jgi:hypothetical protein
VRHATSDDHGARRVSRARRRTASRRTIALLCAVGAALSMTAVASAFDREPVRLGGMRPDGWGNSITGAAKAVRTRYSDTGTTYCVGVIMKGAEKDSSWVHGTTRYWDKLACLADNGSEFVTFVYDAKGAKANSFTIYRLRHIPK